MIDRRTKNAEIFRDTEQRYTTDRKLVEAVRQSTEAQVFITGKSVVSVPAPSNTDKAKVIVSGKRSLEAAENYAKQGKKVCVLNFASATNPGGGVVLRYYRVCGVPHRARGGKLRSILQGDQIIIIRKAKLDDLVWGEEIEVFNYRSDFYHIF